MNIVGIIGSLLVGIGCFMPWVQYGLFFENGLSNPSSFVLIISSIVTGMLGIYNQTRNENKNLWIYAIVGLIGLIVISIYIYDLNTKAEKLTDGLTGLNKIMGSDKEVSIINILGSGIYLIGFGSFGLLLSGLGVLKPRDNKALPNIDNIEIVAPKNVKDDRKEIDPIEQENKEYKRQVIRLNEIIKKEKGSVFGQSNRADIISTLQSLCKTDKEGQHLLTVYEQLFNTDLIEDIKRTTNSYSGMKDLLDPLINTGLIENKFPHDRSKK